MIWPLVGLAAGALLSTLNNQAAKKREQADMEANAEAIRYSPWSGMKAQMMGHKAGTSDLAAALGGGMQGLQFASQFKGAPEEPEMPSHPGSSGAPLGSAGMTQDFQQHSQDFMKSMPPMPGAVGPEQMAANSPAFNMGVEPQPGSPWSAMPRNKKLSFYSGSQ